MARVTLVSWFVCRDKVATIGVAIAAAVGGRSALHAGTQHVRVARDTSAPLASVVQRFAFVARCAGGVMRAVAGTRAAFIRVPVATAPTQDLSAVDACGGGGVRGRGAKRSVNALRPGPTYRMQGCGTNLGKHISHTRKQTARGKGGHGPPTCRANTLMEDTW